MPTDTHLNVPGRSRWPLPIVSPVGRYPYQFAANYAKYAGFPDKAPFDANMLIALIAPRPLLLQTGSTDKWSDPKGNFWLKLPRDRCTDY